MASDLPTSWQYQNRSPDPSTSNRPGLLLVSLGLLCLLLVALPYLPLLQRQFQSIGSTRLALLTTILAVLGLACVGVIGWSFRQYRTLAHRFARRAAQEMVFIELTRRLMTVTDRTEAAEHIAAGSMALAPIAGAYIELIGAEGNEVEVIAAVGQEVPTPGTRIPYFDSPTHHCAERRYPIYLTAPPATDTARPDATPLWILAAPLLSGSRPIGALVLIPSPPRSPTPRRLALDRIQIVADFAAFALQRISLAEEAESRRMELERLLESKARFIRGFTHDLKNPIGAIDGYAQILESEVKGELAPPHREYVARIRTATGSMIRLLDDLVQLARAEAGELRFEPRPTDPTALVNSIIDQYRPNATERGIELEYATPHPLPELEIDAERVRQVVGNLLSNAIKYTPAPGSITIRTEITTPGNSPRPNPSGSYPGRWLAITVSDSGPGIDLAEQERIFEEFIRLHPDNSEGTGLGLAISRHLARAMGGEITVESRPGHGANFTLWLPAT